MRVKIVLSISSPLFAYLVFSPFSNNEAVIVSHIVREVSKSDDFEWGNATGAEGPICKNRYFVCELELCLVAWRRRR